MLGFAAMSTTGGPDGPPIPQLEHTEIDGVPVWWTDVPGPHTGALMFGVGKAHERAATSGISHLVEHLTLAPLTQQEYSHNGFVTGPRTVFHATGNDDELIAYFRTVGESLGQLPLDRLGMERRILRQEERGRGPSVAGNLMWLRYGNQGHGLLGMEELGLNWLGPSTVEAWAHAMFARGNAAMWLSAPPPAGLRLPLPDGGSVANAPADPLPSITFPAHLEWSPNRVAMSWIAPRSVEAIATLDTVARRAREVLRFERGLVYDIHTDYERLDAGSAHCAISTDCAAEHAVAVRDELLGAFDAIASDGLTDDEVRRAIRSFSESISVPQASMGLLDGVAFDRLVGARVLEPPELVAEYDGLDPRKAGDTLARASTSLLLCAPGGRPDPARWTTYEPWSVDVVEGRRYRPRGRRFAGVRVPKRAPEQSLTVGPDGVTWRSPDGHTLTVRYRDCVAYSHVKGDAREICGADGFRVRIVPTEWENGMDAVRAIDAAVPPELVVCDEHGIGAYLDRADYATETAAPS
jgi:zinc protease